MKRFFCTIILGSLFGMAGCTQNGIISIYDKVNGADLFLEKSEIGAYNEGERVLEFDADLHQLNFNVTENRFTLQSDDNSRFVSVQFPDNGVYVNDFVSIEVSSFGLHKLPNGTWTGQILKKVSDKLWIWDDKNAIGYIIYSTL